MTPARPTISLAGGAGRPDAALLATLNRFHFTRLRLAPVAEEPQGPALRLGEGGALVLERPGAAPAPLSRPYLALLDGFVADYLRARRELDNRTHRPAPSAEQGGPAPFDALADALEDELCARLGITTPRPARPFGLILTHDVDIIGRCALANLKSGLVFLRGALRALSAQSDAPAARFFLRLGLRFLAGRVDYFGFPRILELAARGGFTPTFFLYARLPGGNGLNLWQRLYGVNPNYDLDAPLPRQALELLRRAGAHIGLHGSYRSFDDAAMLGAERAWLEQRSGQPCVSIRQHYLRIGGRDTLEAYARVGFRHESNSGFVCGNGHLLGTTRPFYAVAPGDGCGTGVVSVPMVFMDAVPLYFRPEAPEATRREIAALLETARSLGGVVAFNFHQRMITAVPEYAELYAGAAAEARRLGGRVCGFADLDELYPEVPHG